MSQIFPEFVSGYTCHFDIYKWSDHCNFKEETLVKTCLGLDNGYIPGYISGLAMYLIE